MRIPTPYVHVSTGRPIIISQGIGNWWSVYIEKPNGSLQRCKQFQQYETSGDAYAELSAYKGKALRILSVVGDRERKGGEGK